MGTIVTRGMGRGEKEHGGSSNTKTTNASCWGELRFTPGSHHRQLTVPRLNATHVGAPRELLIIKQRPPCGYTIFRKE